MTQLFRLSCAAYAAVWLWALWQLPERVPMHFGLGGEVDGWASRGTALVVLGLVGLGVGLMLWVALRRVARDRLTGVNAPHKRWWLASQERRERFREMVGQDLAGIGGATMLLLASALLAMTASAAQARPSLPAWYAVLVAAYLLGIVGWTVWAYAVRYRPDPGPSA